ncbi:hypothetical protein JCM10450v2_000354 [Rhodotorula kratochvilovae]
MDELRSHIFCIDCANALISMPQICPACETVLPDNEDVVQMLFNQHDSYKTSILSGLSPTTILDIATRALNFYTYQVQQEGAFQALITKNAQERIAVLEAQCNTITREAHAEIGLLKDRVTTALTRHANAERDLEFERRRVHELQETHKANAKAYSKLKACSSSRSPLAQYDKAKQRALLQPGDATSFPAALQSGHVGGTPAHTPRGGSSARQQFVPVGAQPAQQFRPASVLSQSAAAHGGWTPQQAHGPQGAVPFAQASVLNNQYQQQHQPASRARRSLRPEQQHARAPVNAVGAGGPLPNSTGLGARRGSGGSSGSGGSGGQQRVVGGGFAGAQEGGMSGFLGLATTGGAGAAPQGGRGGFRPAQPHSRQSG